MPKITIPVENKVGKDEAKTRLEPVFPKLIEDFEGTDVKTSWEGDKCSFEFKSRGFGIKGETEIKDEEVITEIDLPYAAMLFKTRIIKAVTKFVGGALV